MNKLVEADVSENITEGVELSFHRFSFACAFNLASTYSLNFPLQTFEGQVQYKQPHY